MSLAAKRFNISLLFNHQGSNVKCEYVYSEKVLDNLKKRKESKKNNPPHDRIGDFAPGGLNRSLISSRSNPLNCPHQHDEKENKHSNNQSESDQVRNERLKETQPAFTLKSRTKSRISYFLCEHHCVICSKSSPILRIFGIPKRVPTKSRIKRAAITTTRPIRPLVILFLADSIACLSPPAPIIPIAPEIKTKANQIIATMVISPMVVDINLLKRLIPEPSGFPNGPKPLSSPKSSCARCFMVREQS